MTGQPRPWRPEDFDDHCETCGAPPGQLCKPRCDTGYTADDYRRDAVRHQETADHDRTRPAAVRRPHRP
ncbi:hypothetical protein ACWEV9_32735 [Streptomyces albogriseolus]|uniref:hypothetical protein n=1 Tax=Streptomyces albogriseolus TaxID=1887 RepID=UPI00345F98F8